MKASKRGRRAPLEENKRGKKEREGEGMISLGFMEELGCWNS